MKRRAKIIFVFFSGLFLLSSISCFSQSTIASAEDINQQTYIARIKQFNEFINRFNYIKDFAGNPVDTIFSEKYPRERYMEHLFDKESFNQSLPAGDIRREFINQVCGNKQYIYKYSPKIIAAAETKVLYNGNETIITVFLNQEIVGDDMVKWVILDARGEVLNFMETDTAYVRFIPPSSNETNFMNMKRAMQDSLHLQDYAYQNYKYDPLSVFFYCLNKDIIEIEYVEELSYYIIDIPGWCMKIEDINRSGYNSGWLITELFKCDLDIPGFMQYISSVL